MRKSTLGRSTIRAILFCLIVVGCVGCGKLGTTNIGEILGHPRDYANREVTVSGEVTETFSLILYKVF